MKLDIEYSNNVESVLKVFNNPDARKFCVWFSTINAICSEYKDKKSIDLVLKIYDITGLNFFLSEKHTYKELEDFYKQIQPINIDEKFTKNGLVLDVSNLKDEPEEEEVEEEVDIEEESEEEQEEQEQKNSSTFAKESVSYDADITEDVKQRADVIKTTNAKRAARHAELKNRNPNVKCNL